MSIADKHIVFGGAGVRTHLSRHLTLEVVARALHEQRRHADGGRPLLAEEPDGSVWLGATDQLQLRAPDGGFFIETASPETQWIEKACRRSIIRPRAYLHTLLTV